MILLDADVLVMDLRYPNDSRFATNHQALQQLHIDAIPVAVTSQALLETIGILSFNLSQTRIPRLPRYLVTHYRLTVIPDLQQQPDYAGCTVAELLVQVGKQMALGDAVQAVQIARYAASADCLLTWNARHFLGKLTIPALSPQDWLQHRLGTVP